MWREHEHTVEHMGGEGEGRGGGMGEAWGGKNGGRYEKEEEGGREEQEANYLANWTRCIINTAIVLATSICGDVIISLT